MANRLEAHAVCKGQTASDRDEQKQDLYLSTVGQDKSYIGSDGKSHRVADTLPKQQFGNKEFPHDVIAATLATLEHEGKATQLQKQALSAMREYPNSPLLGRFNHLNKRGQLSESEQQSFERYRVEAGCVKGARIDQDGSIIFDK